jgi:hypothetical protein
MRTFPWFFFFFALMFAFVGRCFAQAARFAGWTTHTDPRGFSIDAPADWNFSPDAQQGRVVLRGPRGELAVLWPMSIDQRQLDASSAEALVQQLARNVDGQLPWTSVGGATKVARVMARGTQRSGMALLTWSSSSASGMALLLYCVEAPTAVYRASTDTFAGIIQSLRLVPEGTPSGAAAQTAARPLSFVTWTDPREGAFSMSIPQGWQAVGGSYRLTASDVRMGVTVVSPDGGVRVEIGDSSIGSYIEPSQMLAFAGLHEGQYYSVGDGTRFEIRRYMSGQQFARAYAVAFGRQQCPGLNIESNNNRTDIAAQYLPSARANGAPYARLTAGDVTVTCTMHGAPARGYLIAATVYPAPGQSGIWYVYRLYGYVAPPDRQQEGSTAAQQAMQSWHINPTWQAQESQIAAGAVQADNLRSQQIQSRALQAIQEDQRQINETIVKGYEQRSQVYNEISRKRENAILGTLDVVDPDSGARYKVSNYSDYHWMNNSGLITGNNTGTSPGPDWRELITLP